MAESQASKSSSVLCPCGAGICSLLTSNTQKNPGRQFYRCPANRCQFFKWLDQVESYQTIEIPVCACGAGICRLQSKSSGPNAGRKYFVCRIKKGQGACNYFKWQDAQVNVAMSSSGDKNFSFSPSILSTCGDPGPSNDNQVEEGDPTNLGHEIEPFNAETLQFSKNPVSTSSLLERDKILKELKGSDDGSDEPSSDPSRKRHKRLRHGDSESDVLPFGSSSECLAMPLPNLRHSLSEEPAQDSFQTPKMEINEEMNEFGSRVFDQETILTASCSFPSSYSYCSSVVINSEVLWESCLIRQGLLVQLHGWLGRLAFPPSRCLMEPAPKPLFCCVFPSFDPIHVSPQVNLCDDHVPGSSLGRSYGAENNRQPLSTLNRCPKLLCPQQSSRIMIELVSKAFAKAAEQLQDDLLTLLKSMDIQDHETMSQEADATFAALDQLQIDHQKFSGQVKEFISYASVLAKIDQSISNDHSCELLLDRFNSDKRKLDEINDAFAQGVDAFFASNQRLVVLSKEVSHLKDKLFQMEDELSRCKVENSFLKARIAQIREDKGKVWETFQNTVAELENAYKLREFREAGRRAAKAAFEKAKIVLWG